MSSHQSSGVNGCGDSCGLLAGPDLLMWARQRTFVKPGKVCKVIPNLFQGNKAGAGSKKDMTGNKIAAIVSVGGGPCRQENVKFLHIGAKDGDSLLDEFEETVDMIHDMLREGNAVFVHCMGGISRSPSMVIAYLVKHRDLNLREALELMRLVRPRISPNGELGNDLVQWEKRVRGETTMTVAELRQF